MNGIYFCKQCGKILELQKKEENNTGICSCGFTTIIPEIAFAQPKEKEQVGAGVIREETSTGGFPHTCKKCSYGFCDPTQINAPYSDESDIYLYRCKKCKFVERQADGTGNT
ncbi:MAG: hypothetical protein AABY00_04165 [Nanoarchaeota archaeon]